MPRSLQAIKSAVKSVKNTKKITKTMQLIATSKLQRVASQIAGLKSYSDKLMETSAVVQQAASNSSSSIKASNPEGKDLLIVFSSDRGLCGAFNSRINKFVRDWAGKQDTLNPAVLCVGKKGAPVAKSLDCDLVGVYPASNKEMVISNISPYYSEALEGFESLDKYRSVTIFYTEFISSSKQEVAAKQILPIELDAKVEIVEDHEGEVKEESSTTNKQEDIILEPDQQTILDYLIRRSIELTMFRCYMESQASEHSSRMTAMSNATDNASDMIDSLTTEYNKTRQAAITQEIAQIVNGMQSIQ